MTAGAVPDLFATGDRLPNFAARGADGVREAFHARRTGAPLLIVAVKDLAVARKLEAELTDLALDLGHLECVLWVGPGEAATIAPGGWEVTDAPPELRVRVLGDSPWAALLTDANLRVRERFVPDAGTLTARVAARAPVPPGDGPAPVAAGTAPVLQVPDVLEPAFCDELIAWYREAKGGGGQSGIYVTEHGKTEFRLDPGVKARREALIDDRALVARLDERLVRRLLPEIDRVFCFRVAKRDPFKLISYEAGAGYFRPHRDNDSRETAHRRFALTLNLNTGEYAGGRLRFPEFGTAQYEAPRGGAVVFSCSLLHEATPVTEGQRYALVTFFD
jgi:predicted 2-oxoglutarate/Fe(II)-dependent dioxygenase YbiX